MHVTGTLVQRMREIKGGALRREGVGVTLIIFIVLE